MRTASCSTLMWHRAGAACLPGPSAALPVGLAPRPLLLLCSLQPASSSKCELARLVLNCPHADAHTELGTPGYRSRCTSRLGFNELQSQCLCGAGDLLPLLQVYAYCKAMSKPMCCCLICCRSYV